MKVFICYRSTDKSEGEKIISALLTDSENSVAILKQTEHIDNWKNIVETKIKESDFVAFLIGSETFKSQQIIWEYGKAKSLNKQIIGIKLDSASDGYFGGTMPAISVKPCHYKRPYNYIKKLLLFLFQYSFSERLALKVYAV